MTCDRYNKLYANWINSKKAGREKSMAYWQRRMMEHADRCDQCRESIHKWEKFIVKARKAKG